MATSQKYNNLVLRVSQLETNLLPIVDPSGSFTDRDYDLIRAYCLICHAEIESYLEEYIKEIIVTAYNKWFLNKNNISTIIFHLAYNYNGKKDLPYSMVVNSYLHVIKLIEKNNGIKDINLIPILKIIGFTMDPLLLQALTDFGETRGEIAHTSFQTQQPLDPATQKSAVHLILTGLKDFDEELSLYESSGTASLSPAIQWSQYSILQRIKFLFTSKL